MKKKEKIREKIQSQSTDETEAKYKMIEMEKNTEVN